MCVCLCCVCVCVSLAICESIVTFRRENPFTTGQRIVNVYWCKVVIICRHVLEGGGKDSEESGQERNYLLPVSFGKVGTENRCGILGFKGKYEEQINVVVFCFTAITPPLCRVRHDYVDVDYKACRPDSLSLPLLFCSVGPQFDKPSPKPGESVRVFLCTKHIVPEGVSRLIFFN